MFPVRCYACNTVTGHVASIMKEHQEHEEIHKILDDHGLKRYCCRAQVMSNVNIRHKVDVVGTTTLGRLEADERLKSGSV